MRNWFLITHNFHAFQLVAGRLEALGVEVFTAQRIEVIMRTDRNTPRSIKKQLFPGYLFIRFCPEEVHTTTISDLPGVKGFVRFGHEICRVQDSVIEALKTSVLMRVNSSISAMECGNISPEVINDLMKITRLETPEERQVALLSLLKRERLHTNHSSRICSNIFDVT